MENRRNTVKEIDPPGECWRCFSCDERRSGPHRAPVFLVVLCLGGDVSASLFDEVSEVDHRDDRCGAAENAERHTERDHVRHQCLPCSVDSKRCSCVNIVKGPRTCSSTNNVGRRYEVILLVIDQVKPK